MNPERLTEKAREAISGAQKIAARMDHQSIDAEHLLLSLLDQEKGLTAAVLNKAGVSVDALTIRVQREVEKMPKVANVTNQGVTARFSKVMAAAEDEAITSRDQQPAELRGRLAIPSIMPAAGTTIDADTADGSTIAVHGRCVARKSGFDSRLTI